MPVTIEERVARLEEKAEHSNEKIEILFDKLDRLIDKIDLFTTLIQNVELEHKACVKTRQEQSGWLQGRLTKILDAALAGGLVVVLFFLLKNAGTLLVLMGSK